MNALKPGTRCECREFACQLAGMGRDHVGHTTWTHDWDEKPCQCTQDAVRLVTVRRDGFTADPKTYRPIVAMCQACAEYHERDKAERETASAIHAIHGLPGEPEPEVE